MTAPTDQPGPTAEQPGGTAATVPVNPRPGAARWGIALAVVALMIGVVAAAAVLLTTQSQPEALAYVPSGSLAVVEVRPDLPGDQRQALGTILGHFPGFADQSNLGAKIDEALDQLVQRATDGKRHYVGDLKPYATGPLYLAVPSAPATGASTGAASSPNPKAGGANEPMLAVLTTDGSVGCQGLEDGATVTVERYRDVDVRVRTADSRSVGCAVAGKFVLFGDVGSVKASLDAKANGRSVAGDARYQTASRAILGDHLAWGYVDAKGFLAMAAAAASPSAMPSALSGAVVPDWAAFAVKASSAGPVIETVTPDTRAALLGAAASGAPARTPKPDAISAIAPHLPASTIVAAEVHDLGGVISTALASARQAPGGADALSQVESALSFVGGVDGILGPLDQAAVVVTLDGGKANGGVVIQTTDAAFARTRVDQIGTLLTMAGIQGATTETYKDARLVKVPLAGLLAVAGGSLPGGLGGGSASLPPDVASQSLVLALHDNLVVVGLGDAFAKAIVDTPSGSSLADQSAYRAAVELAGSPNIGQVYVDVPDLVTALRSSMTADQGATFDRDVKPYLQPIAAVAMSATGRDGLVRSRIVVSIP